MTRLIYCFLEFVTRVCPFLRFAVDRGTRAITPTAPTLLRDLVYRCLAFPANFLLVTVASILTRDVCKLAGAYLSYHFAIDCTYIREKEEEEKIFDQSRSASSYADNVAV